MLCIVCRLNKLEGQQVKYCSKSCERKWWRDNNREKLLEGKRLYRERNKEKILAYAREYKRRVKKIDNGLSRTLRAEHSCLRCTGKAALEVHHIKRQDIGGGVNDRNNLVVLCKDCHALWHKMFPMSYWLYGQIED